jgi:hypothetical protein
MSFVLLRHCFFNALIPFAESGLTGDFDEARRLLVNIPFYYVYSQFRPLSCSRPVRRFWSNIFRGATLC